MFRVIGDVLEYDGKPFAVITAPLSGFRMEAVDAFNNYDAHLSGVVDEKVTEAQIDNVSKVSDVLEKAVDKWLITQAVSDSLLEDIRNALE